MAITLDEVRRLLSPDEPDYGRLAALGPDVIPHLAHLVEGPDVHLATKAASLAGRVAAGAVVVRAAASPHPTVRVAAADSARLLPPEAAAPAFVALLGDADPGVRKVALRSLPDHLAESVRAALAHQVADETVPALRELAVSVGHRVKLPNMPALRPGVRPGVAKPR